MRKPPAIICDLDGTLCDMSHRRHFMECRPKKRDEFHAALVNDPINKNVKALLECWGRTLLFVTGRSEKYRPQTEAWLKSHDVAYDDLLMRADDDMRQDYVVKGDVYVYLIAPHYEVTLVLEDKTTVVNMWREYGLECWQVANGDYG